MKKKIYFLLLAIFFVSPFLFVSCSDDDDDPDINPDPELTTSGVYILNNGSYGQNNSTLDYYNPETNELTKKVFNTSNGRGLGDTANDLLVYGSKMYIVVNVSSTIEITDLEAGSLQTISLTRDEQPQQPRFAQPHKGKVYVTTYDGYVVKIDTTSLEVEGQVEVGLGAEQLSIVGDKLYTAVSGYMTPMTKVAEVDLTTFTKTKDFEVIVAPRWMQADKNGNLYVMSAGNYADIKQTVQKLDTKTGETKVICEDEYVSMTLAGDYLYIISAKTDSETWSPIDAKYLKYNVETETMEEKEFVNSSVAINYPTYLDVDPVTEQIYITAGLATNTGDVYIVSPEGDLVNKVELSGYNPVCSRFLTILE